MASTRNRNTIGDYRLEEQRFKKHETYMTKHESVGNIYLPGNGLLGQKCPNTVLANNATDIESYLRGIGSTNLVKPKPDPVPELYNMKSLNICERSDVIVPATFVPLTNQRPFPR